MFGLADRLHKTIDEIEALSIDELASWAAYLKILQDKAKQ